MHNNKQAQNYTKYARNGALQMVLHNSVLQRLILNTMGFWFAVKWKPSFKESKSSLLVERRCEHAKYSSK